MTDTEKLMLDNQQLLNVTIDHQSSLQRRMNEIDLQLMLYGAGLFALGLLLAVLAFKLRRLEGLSLADVIEVAT